MKNKDTIVIHMRVEGSTKKALEEVREMCCLPSNNETVRYLMARGLESLSPQRNAKAFLERIERSFDKDRVLEVVREMTGEGKG